MARMIVHPETERPARRALAAAPRLRLVDRPPLRVADVALFYGERSGGIRTYLDAKIRHLATGGACEHHVIVPGPRERHAAGRHELPSLRMVAANGYRIPLGARCVVMPGEHETFGLAGLEAAASGARVVCCTTAPSGRALGDLADTFLPGDRVGLGGAITAARAADRRPHAAAALAARFAWPRLFAEELERLRELAA